MNVVNKSSIKVTINENALYMNSVSYSGGTSISEVNLLNGNTHRAITGKDSFTITMKTNILPCDRDFYQQLINSLSGEKILSITIDTTRLINIVLLKGYCQFSDNSFTGECILKFKEL